MREDLFQRGGLADLLHACPWPLARLLRLVSLKWFFGHVRTLPMRRLREFTWQDTLRELVRAGLGPSDPAAVFNARGQAELRCCLGSLPARVDAINPWRMGPTRVALWGLRRLTVQTLRQVAPGFRAVVARHLQDFVRRLDAGHSVYFAPEGHVSVDGGLGRIRAGTWLLGRMASVPLVLMPVTLSYDPLCRGRARVVVHAGDMLRGLDFDDPSAFVREVRHAILTHRVVTPSHLLARFLCVRDTPFTARELTDWMETAKQVTQDAGLALDPVFARMTTDALVDERLDWLRRKHLVGRQGNVWHNRWAADTPPGWRQATRLVRYLSNALEEFSPGLAKVLSA